MLVMKFGGTSVKDAAAISQLVNIVKSKLPQKPVVVSSAISKATDVLISAAELASIGNIDSAEDMISELNQRHLNIAKDILKDSREYSAVKQIINGYFSEINDLLKGVFLLSELSPRTNAKIVSYGELLSTSIIAAAFNFNHINAELFDSRRFIITDDNYLKGEPLLEEISVRVSGYLKPVISNGVVPVVQGFIASNSEGITTVLGRGGSDYTASLIGLALEAEAIEIWTDVDGMLTADPRKVKGTKIINKISFEEAAELAYFGAKVLHPLTIQPAVEKNIPVLIKNSISPEKEGTRIVKDSAPAPEADSPGKDSFDTNAGIKSIACKENIIVMNIFSTRMLNSYGFLNRIFEVFEKHKTSVDLIATSEVNVSLTLESDEFLDAIAADISKFAIVKIEHDKSLICIVGSNLKNLKGVAGKIFSVLSDYNITMISQGASLINISFVVNRNILNNALQKLHNAFFKK